jgi:large subunit ribosomal protein L25
MKIAVTAYPRTLQGTSASRRLRTSGRVPGIIYGAGKAAQNVEVDQAALLRHLKLEVFHASVLDLTVDGETTQALLRDFQMHPFKPIALHVDFQRVDKNRKIHMKVPLHFVNTDICVGVKEGGGVVQHIINDLEILCLPDDLPEYIEVDVRNLQVAHSMHVNDLAFPQGVEPIPRWKKENPGVVTVQLPKEAPVEEGAVVEAVTEITGQKPEDLAAAAAAAGSTKDGVKKEAPKKEPAAKKEGAK